MKKVLLVVLFSISLYANEFETYLKSFDLEERTNMKVKMVEMLNLVEENKAQVIDIRFKEEYEVWSLNFTKNIPLNELPNRLDELDKNKLIITVCPHNDRANMARMYLKLKGYKARYLSDGLLKAVNYLRGDNAKEFLEEYRKNKTK
jgi:rhodanese-related sulfurtransferase